MSQAEIVKSRIIDVVWQPREPPPATRPEPSPAEITTFAWATTPVVVVEDVQLPPQPDTRLVALNEPDSSRAQGYRLLQHRLFALGNPRVIAVTSAGGAEGKSTCAANLSLVLSEEAMSRVLLVDAHLARPGVGELFGYDPGDSFVTKLLRSDDAAPPYAVASIDRLRLQLAAPNRQVNRGKRLDRALFAEAIRELRSCYDYIVIDTASVLESADAHGACLAADAVLVAARAGRTRRARVAQAIDQLAPANVVGSVLIDT
jgi:Mrp family chromosome partitioning ATPase